MTQTYPVILAPTAGATLVRPNSGGVKNKKHGPSELIAFGRIVAMGLSDKIHVDKCVRIAGHNYEPDIAYIDETRGIYVDIEVDEPYSAGGKPTHYMNADGTNKDSERNRRFTEAGWHVLRFTEEQLFCHPQECMRELFKLLLRHGGVEALPNQLENANDLHPTIRWTYGVSQRMKRVHYRNSYLRFNPNCMGLQGYWRCFLHALPILGYSLTNSKLRKEFASQLYRFFFH